MVNWEELKRVLLYLLSHHTEEHLDRALCIKLFGRRLYICARCTGLTLGFITGILMQAFSIITYLEVRISLLLVVCLALPAMVDWWTQSVFGRESKNYIRVPTGYALGFGITLLRFTEPVWTIVTVVIFFLFAVFAVYRRVIREYGPKSDRYPGRREERKT
ncbi:MAG: DUF2085 domain-containing protein [Candidatus Freyarchaeota archaeon]